MFPKINIFGENKEVNFSILKILVHDRKTFLKYNILQVYFKVQNISYIKIYIDDAL